VIPDPSPECVKYLISVLTSVQANLRSSTFSQTPLLVAAHYGRLKSVQIMLDSGKCDVSATDACGEQALHHAIKQGHQPIVALLLKSAQRVEQESGLGANILDTSMGILLQEFGKHRNDNQKDDAQPSSQTVSIFQDVQKRVPVKSRKLCKLDDVNRFSRIMIENANIMTDVTKKKLSRWHRNDQSANVDIHTTGEGSGITWEFRSFSDSESSKEEDDDPKDEPMGEEEPPTSLNGMTFAITGNLTMKRADVISLIKKNGGTYATSVTKAVTHLIVEDVNEDTAKITDAKAAGKKIVGESFLSKLK